MSFVSVVRKLMKIVVRYFGYRMYLVKNYALSAQDRWLYLAYILDALLNSCWTWSRFFYEFYVCKNWSQFFSLLNTLIMQIMEYVIWEQWQHYLDTSSFLKGPHAIHHHEGLCPWSREKEKNWLRMCKLRTQNLSTHKLSVYWVLIRFILKIFSFMRFLLPLCHSFQRVEKGTTKRTNLH